jgi:hypothetical protein
MSKASTPEGKIKARLSARLKAEKVWYFCPQSGIYGAAGIPDFIAIAGGQFIGIECKADGSKKPTALQVLRMKQIEDAGGKCFVVYSDETIEEVMRWIRFRK